MKLKLKQWILGASVALVTVLAYAADDFNILDVQQAGGAASITSGTISGTAVAATTLSASSTVTLTPANTGVTISPSGTGVVTMNPGSTGTMNNMTIGNANAKAGTFTNLTSGGTTNLNVSTNNTVNIGTGTTTSTVSIGGGSNTVSIGSPMVLAAGTATKAPLTFTAGTSLTTPAVGVIEYNGSNYFGTVSGPNRYFLLKGLMNSATLDFPDTAAQTNSDLTITVTGAALNDTCSVGAPHASVLASTSYICWVSAADTVTVRLNVYGVLSRNPDSGTFRVSLVKS